MQYRIKNTQITFPRSELATRFPNTSVPSNLTPADLDFLNLEEVPDPAPTAQEIAASLSAAFALTVAESLIKIDADTDRIYGAVLGNRAEEYTRAATEAQAYKDANYAGNVPASVQSWATAKSWTATQATDDILATAAQWTGAQAAIRAARLLRKEQVRTAPNAAGVTVAMNAWAGFVVYIRGQLGLS